MTQVAFVTLFLGLTLGSQPVELRVTGPVHHVEIRLDDAVLGVIAAPPWKTSIDVGGHLLPHRLTAIAMDAAGHELARAEQKINVPRRSAETEILLERNAAGHPAKAHLLWRSVDADKAAAARLTLDGEPLALDSKLTADIANVDTTRPHVVRARVEAPDGTATETEIAFGGLEAQAGRSLTGIPIRLLTHDAALTRAALKEWLTTPAGAADVAGVENLAGDVIIVRDPSNGEAIGRLEFGRARGAVPHPLAESSDAALRHDKPQARFVWPTASAAATKLPTYILPLTRPFEFATADDLKAVMARVAAPRSTAHLKYADAVATAGLRAAAAQRPRAVVLLIGGHAHDESELSPRQASEYLRAVGVPLFVWSFAQPEASREWGDVVDVSSPKAFRRAFDALNESLRSQRIVWIEGDYLPAEVAVTPAGRGVIQTLAGQGTAGGQELQGRVEVHAIELTTSVHDATGHVPRGLGPEDFVVLENGTPQKVIGVDYTEAAAPSQDRLVRNGQVVVFLQQSLSSTKGLRLALRSLASEAESAVAAGAVEVVTDYPRPHWLFGPTRDPIALRAFLEKLGNEITGEEELTRIRTAFAANDLPKEAENRTQAWMETAWRSDQIQMRARRESAVLRTREDALVGWLSHYPAGTAGPLRTLLLVSDGFDLEPASFYHFDASETRAARRQELRTLSASSHHEEIARALAGEHWAVISFAMAEAPHAPAPSKFQSRAAPSVETAPAHVVPVPPVNRFPLAPLVRLADATGGDVATDAQNAAWELRELSDRIVITYQTESPADDTLRHIEVTSRRTGLTIRAPKWAGNVTAGAVAESLASSLATETATSDGATASGTLPLTCSITLGPVANGVSTSEVEAHVDLKPIADLVAPDEQGSLAFTVAVITPNEPPFTTTRRLENLDLAAPDGYTCTLEIRHRRNARIAVVASEPSTGAWGTCVVDGATLH